MATNEQKYWLHSTLGVHGVVSRADAGDSPGVASPGQSGGASATRAASGGRRVDLTPFHSRDTRNARPILQRDAQEVQRVLDPNRDLAAESLAQLDAEERYERHTGTISSPPRDTVEEFRSVRASGAVGSIQIAVSEARGLPWETARLQAQADGQIGTLVSVVGARGAQSADAVARMPRPANQPLSSHGPNQPTAAPQASGPDPVDPGAPVDTGLNRRLIPAHELVTVSGGRADSSGRTTPRQRREAARIASALGHSGPVDAAHLNPRSQSPRGPFRVRPQDPSVNRGEGRDIARANEARRRWNAEHPDGPHLPVRDQE